MTDALRKLDADRAASLLEIYRAELFDNVLPWWLEHSPDREAGGYFTRLGRDGRPYAEHKDMWMTGRQIWMLSRLFNQVEQNPAWLELARHGVVFMHAHAFRPDGGMYFRIDRSGRPLAEVLSQYTEVFTAIAFCEYARAADDATMRQRALDLYQRLMPRLERLENTPMLAYPMNQEFSLHAKAMCRMTVAEVFEGYSNDASHGRDRRMAADEIIGKHWKPDLHALLENVAPDGTPLLDYPEGRLFHPGHAIESAWMLMEIALADADQGRFAVAVDILLAAVEQGWDKDFGGIRYLTNIDWSPVHNIEADCKLWWPHAEALYALLLAWQHTSRRDIAAWYERVHEYTFSHFPDRQHGEWYGYLNRDGSPVWTAKANGWKGFFHLPRALLLCYQTLQGQLANPVSGNSLT